MKWLIRFVAVAALAVPGAVQAGPITDPLGDFLPTYTGPRNGDLDVLVAGGTIDGSRFRLFTTLAAPFGTTPTGGGLAPSLVWGLNRGAGTERFGPVGPGVLFDSVVSLTPAGVARFNDLLNPANSFNLDPSEVRINGADAEVTFLRSRVPSTGFAQTDFTWNLWPRSGPGNPAISDFAPNATGNPLTANARFDAVPEPATLAVLAAGAGLLGWRRLRRRAA